MSKRISFSDVKILNLNVIKDSRGYFTETYNKDFLLKNGISNNFIQDNQSFSEKKNTLRGMHFQLQPYDQSKLIRVISGSIYDVFIDLRKDSEKYLHYGAYELNPNSGLLYIPSGFAHGFLTLSDKTLVSYKVDKYYDKKSEFGIKWDDPSFSIEWPNIKDNFILSEKDNNLPLWNEIEMKVTF
mgnify:FL=1